MIKKLCLILILMVLTVSACQKTQAEATLELEGEPFELYLVADPNMTGVDLKDHELEDLPLTMKPLIKTENIYNFIWEGQAINLKEEAYKNLLYIFSNNIPMTGLPFVVLSYGERLYAGAFWTPFSSVSFDGIAIVQPLDPAGMPLFISLGYPSKDFYTGEDPRFDPRLKQALENADLLWDPETGD